MIRVIKEATPDSLAGRGEQETRLLCEAQQGARELEFKARVYGHQDVRQALWRSQAQKCCYCEERINLRGADVDHYRPKAGVRQARGAPEVRPGYFWLAYQWDNLYLACHECNVIWKGSLFPLRDEQQRARSPRDSLAQEAPLLLDPGHDDPDEHISWRDEVPRGITTPGQTTIAVLGLDRDDGVAGRMMLLERRRQLWSQVHQVCLLLRSPLPTETAKELTEKLLAMAMPAAPFSAMVRAELRRQGVL